jgi:hypothetical protein
MMALSEQDRDWIKLVAKEVAAEVGKELIRDHIASCPHGKRLLVVLSIAAGAGVFAGSAAGSLISSLLHGGL